MQIADAAQVIGTTKKAVQKWLEKGQIPWLAHARPEKGLTAEFSITDLLRMRMVVVLLDYGTTVKQAAWLVPHIIDKAAALLVPNIIVQELDDASIPFFVDYFNIAIVTRTGEKDWRVTISTNEADAVAQHWRDPLMKAAPAALVIRLSNLFQEVLDRIEVLNRNAA
jgi:hypothetical protein